MEMWVLSQYEAEDTVFTDNDHVISITTSGSAQIIGADAVLPLNFGDVGSEHREAMTQTQAQLILQFAQEARVKDKTLWVHCWLGVSRSAAVTQALEELGFGDWTNKNEVIWVPDVGDVSVFVPNPHVLSMIKRVAAQRLIDGN